MKEQFEDKPRDKNGNSTPQEIIRSVVENGEDERHSPTGLSPVSSSGSSSYATVSECSSDEISGATTTSNKTPGASPSLDRQDERNRGDDPSTAQADVLLPTSNSEAEKGEDDDDDNQLGPGMEEGDTADGPEAPTSNQRPQRSRGRRKRKQNERTVREKNRLCQRKRRENLTPEQREAEKEQTRQRVAKLRQRRKEAQSRSSVGSPLR